MTLAGFKLLLFLLFAAIVAGTTAWATHRFDNARYLALELKYANAQREAVAAAQAEQKRLDDIGRQAAQDEAVKQQALAETAQAQLAEVQSHVSDIPAVPVRGGGTVVRPCITYGLVRLLDSAVLGVSASSLRLPTGGADADCTSLNPVTLAQSIVRNYATARANAEQLNSLEAFARKLKPAEKH